MSERVELGTFGDQKVWIGQLPILPTTLAVVARVVGTASSGVDYPKTDGWYSMVRRNRVNPISGDVELTPTANVMVVKPGRTAVERSKKVGPLGRRRQVSRENLPNVRQPVKVYVESVLIRRHP